MIVSGYCWTGDERDDWDDSGADHGACLPADPVCPYTATKEEAERQIYDIAALVAERLESMGRVRRGGVCIGLDLRCHPNTGAPDYWIWIEDAKDLHLHRAGWGPPPETAASCENRQEEGGS